MNLFRILSLALTLFSSPLFGAFVESRDVAFYYGPVVYVGADGKTRLSESVSLVRRTVDPVKNQIIEFVSQPDRTMAHKINSFETFINRRGKSGLVFDASDRGKTFSGTITYQGPEWRWSLWTYNIKLKGGGEITGNGQLGKNGILTHKEILNSDGTLSVLVDENLAPISAAQYESYLKQMLDGQL